jgi:hypothetical protein
LLSEHPSFPIDPGVTTIENCRRRVEQDADLFVLIVGMRYGSSYRPDGAIEDTVAQTPVKKKSARTIARSAIC